MAEVVRLGFEAVMYFKLGGQNAAGQWQELTNVKDLTAAFEKGESDSTTRGSNGWEELKGSLKKASLEWNMVWDRGDAGFQAIKDSFFNNTMVGIKALDGPDGEGLLADMECFKFNKNENLAEAQDVAVTMKPVRSGIPPQWIEAA